jgi:methyl-accepting chemotaxis protein
MPQETTMTGYAQSSRSEDRIEILIDQVGRLTEVVMIGFQDMRDESREMRSDLSEIKDITERQARAFERQAKAFEQQAKAFEQQAKAVEQQADVAKQQAESVAKLVAIVENLMQRNG